MSLTQDSLPPDQPRFLNRDRQLELVGQHVEFHRTDSRHLQVFEVVGLGGAGKTELLHEMRRRADNGKQVRHVLWASLHLEPSTTEVGPLRKLRNDTPFHCHLFDTGLLTLLSATGQSVPSDVPRLRSSPAFAKALEAGANVMQVAVPVTFAVEVFGAIKDKFSKAWNYDEEEFAEIDRLRENPQALREQLPRWLGTDIVRRISTTGDTLAIFYDGYEKQAATTRHRQAPWMRELIKTLDRGVHVIATRDRVGWDGWDAVMQPVPVGELPDDEARELIHARLGDIPLEAQDRLLSASKRIPFYLDAAIEHYTRADEVSVARLPSTQGDTLDYLLEHLDRHERSLALALATFQVFDKKLVLSIVDGLHLPVSVFDVDDFIERWFFFEALGTDIYKTHDLLTDFVRESKKESSVRQYALIAAGRELHDRCLAGGAATPVLPMLSGIVAGWQTLAEVPKDAIEHLVDVGYYLHDSGHWEELTAMAAECGPGAAHPIGALTDLFVGVGARRAKGVAHARELMMELESRAGLLGRHARSVEIEIAYLTELSGNYAKAREQFRELDEAVSSFNPADRTHVRARLYHADMMINDGAFLEASRLLLEAYERFDSGTPTWAEFVRHRGHAFRFSFMPDVAERRYREALDGAGHAIGIAGKLRTNLTETLCWSDPESALNEADLSGSLNEQTGNRIELAKCDAARGVALARLGEFNLARQAAARSASLAGALGYPAGVAFAIQAQAVIEHYAGNAEGLAAARERLDSAVAGLGTYSHLRAVPAFLARDAAAVAEITASFSWIAPDDFGARLESILT